MKLVITRGLPGCGKTTRARAWVAEDPSRRVRVNRDDLRTMLSGGPPVVAAVRAMHAAGHRVIFCSGRTADCREATERWLAEHVDVPYDALHMRAVGDARKDAVVKAELFNAHIRDGYQVVAVFDDRRQVVEAWRALGLTVFQVAEGDF
jgi:hypothetical protein